MTEKEKNEKAPEKQGFTIFGALWRIAAIFFVGFSIFLIFSAMMLQFLSTSGKDVKIPELTGRQFMDVYNQLVRKELIPDVTFKEIYDMNEGIILKQDPAPGRVVSADTKIRLTVSRSNILVKVPELTGSPYPIAMNKLKNLHVYDKPVSLPVGMVTWLPSDDIPRGMVMDQRPHSGKLVSPSHRVNMLVSSGPGEPDRRVPGVTGQSVELCIDLLLANGWFIDMDVVETRNPEQNGIIFRQTPGEDAALTEGGTVELGVYYYPSTERPYHAYEKVEITIPQHGESGVYEAYVSDDHSRRTVFYNKKDPGDKISFVFHRTGNARVTILRDKQSFRVQTINADR